MNFYPRHIGDHMKQTSHLSLVEHGVYNLLLDRFYATEQPITRQEAYGVCRPRTRLEKQAVETVLSTLFTDTKAGYVNRRALQEIEKYQEKSLKARQSALTRWSQNTAEKPLIQDTNVMRTHSERNAKAMLSNNQYPISNNQKSNLVPIREIIPEVFKR